MNIARVIILILNCIGILIGFSFLFNPTIGANPKQADPGRQIPYAPIAGAIMFVGALFCLTWVVF